MKYKNVDTGKTTTGVSPAEAMARFCQKKVTPEKMEDIEKNMKLKDGVYSYNNINMKVINEADIKRLQELAGIETLEEGKRQTVFYEKLERWGKLLREYETLDKQARASKGGWDDDIEKEMDKVSKEMDKQRGPLYTSLDHYAVELTKNVK